jgi:ABC-type sugar transport system substrate-binding protein
MIKLKTWATAAAVAGSTVALAACGSSSSSSSTTAAATPSASGSAAAGKPAGSPSGGAFPASLANSGPVCQKGATVGFSMPLPDPNFAVLGPVVKADLQAAGYHVVLTQANLDPGKQISDINSLIAQGIKVLVTNPVVPQSIQPLVHRLNAMHIPIIVQETRIGGPYTTDVTSTVEDAAADGARVLKAAVGGGKVAAMNGLTEAEILARENNAFAAEAKSIGLNVVDNKTNNTDTPDGARVQATPWKTRFGSSLKGVWSFNDGSAVGVASLRGNGFDPKIVSINGEPEIIPFIQQGKVLATYWLQLPKIAHTLSWAVEQALCGKSLPSSIYLPLKKIDKSNISEWLSPAQQAKQPFTVKLVQQNGRWTVANF